MDPDQLLLEYVNRAINAGYQQIGIPQSLLLAASEEAVESVRQMCALCGVEVGVIPG